MYRAAVAASSLLTPSFLPPRLLAVYFITRTIQSANVVALQQHCTAGAFLVTIRNGVTTMLRDASLPSPRGVE